MLVKVLKAQILRRARSGRIAVLVHMGGSHPSHGCLGGQRRAADIRTQRYVCGTSLIPAPLNDP